MKLRLLRRPIALVLTVAMLSGLLCIPVGNLKASAQAGSVQNLLGENWYVHWNSGASEEACVSVVPGGADGSHSLRIGHPTQRTDICLRYKLYKSDMGLTAADEMGIGMKFSAKVEGSFAPNTWIGVINPVSNPGGGNRNNLTDGDLASIGTDWTAIDKGSDYGVWCGPEYDRAEFEFNIVLEAGNYFYLDDLQGYGFWGSVGDMAYVNVVKNGSFEELGQPETTVPETTQEETTVPEETEPVLPPVYWNEVQKKLGENWYVNWNGGTADAADYLEVVEDGSHGKYSLRIGHPSQKTDLCLRYKVFKSDLGLAATEAMGIGMKFSAKLDGSFADGSWIGVINPVEVAAGGNRGNLSPEDMASIGADWTAIDKGSEYGVWCGSEYDRAELEFNIVLEPGNYFYLDDLQGYGYYGNTGEMAYVNVVHNGSFERWYCAWNAMESTTQPFDFAQLVTDGRSGNALRLGNAQLQTDFTLHLQLPAYQPGGYSFDLWAKTQGQITDAAFELFSGNTSGARCRYSLNGVGSEWTHIKHEYSVTDVWVDSGTLLVQLYVYLPAGSYLYLDDIHITGQTGGSYSVNAANMLFDGSFNGYSLGFTAQQAPPAPPVQDILVGAHKHADGWYVSWNEHNQYRSDYLTTQAYGGNYALALSALQANMGHTIATQVDGLEAGAQYILEGQFKKKGSFSSISLMYGSTFLQLKDQPLDNWTLCTGSFTAGTDNVLSIFTVCPQGGMLLVDDLKLYKADDETKTNLLANGDFEITAGSASDMLKMDKAFSAAPTTVEATLRVHQNAQGGVIFGSFDGKQGCNVGINAQGQPYVYAALDGTVTEAVFDGVDVRTGEMLTLTITSQNNQLQCAVNGEVKQTLEAAIALCADAYAIGGDHTQGNPNFFTADLLSLSVYSQDTLLAAWDLEKTLDPTRISDSTENGYDALYYGAYFDSLTADTLEKYPYSFVAVGDTQYTNRGDTQTGQNYLGNLYQWIVDNQAKYNIQAVLGMGDIVDTSPNTADEATKAQSLKEWAHAVNSIGKLNGANIPYTLVKGNHDSIPEYPENDTTVFEDSMKALGYDAQIQGWYEAGGSLANAYITLTVGQTKWLILTLDYNHSAEEIAWADSVITAHPDYKVIVTTHAYLSAKGQWLESSDRCDLLSEDLWEMLIGKHENIEMVLSGHIHSSDVVVRQLRGAGANIVTEMLIDSQSDDRDDYLAAGNTPYAMATLLLFSQDGSEVKVVNYATGKNKFFRADSIATLDLSDGQDIPGPNDTPPMQVPLQDVEIPGWITRWNGNEGTNYRYLTTHAHSGQQALALTGTDDAMSYTYGQLLQRLEAGQEYTLEAYVLYSGRFKMLDLMVGGNSYKQNLKDLPEEQWSKVSMTFVPQESTMALELFADAKAKSLVLLDDVTVYKTADPEKTNLVENPGFEILEVPQTKAPEKVFDYPTDWELWAENEDNSQVFVTGTARHGKQAAAFVNTKKHAASLTQTVIGLKDGLYVLSAYVLSSGGQNDAAMLAKGYDKENTAGQTGTKIQKCGIWTRIQLEFEVTSGQVQISLWNDANKGNWFIVDQMELLKKDDSTYTNLLKNSSFEQAENEPPSQKPIQVELIDRDIPGWVEAWNEYPGRNYRYLTTNSHSGSYALALTSQVGKIGYTFAQRLEVVPGTAYTLEGYIFKSGELDAADILIGPNGKLGKYQVADKRMEGYEKFSISFHPSEDYLELGIFVSGPQSSLLMLDDLVLYENGKGGANLLTNGNFETLEALQTQPPEATTVLPKDWEIWTDDSDPTTVFVTQSGKDGDNAIGFSTAKKQAASLTQTVTGLEKGTYVLTAWVKSSGGQNDAAMLLKGYDQEDPNGQAGTKIPASGIWTPIRLEAEVSSGQVLVSFWHDANEGNWLMVDEVCLYRKDDPTKTNLLANGSFTDVLKPSSTGLPPAGQLDPEQPDVPTNTPEQPQQNWLGVALAVFLVLALFCGIVAVILVKKNKKQ